MDNIKKSIQYLREGGILIVVDDEDRENEGDLVCAASSITADQINFMARYGRGLICLALPEQQIDRLELPMMENRSGRGDHFGTAFTYSIDAKRGVSTGISAADRALTIRLAVDPETSPEELVTPGHIFPLRARPGGVLKRRGHTEAAVDLTRLAGLTPGGVICEIMKEDGEMMRVPDLEKFAKTHDLPMISIEDLVTYRQEQEIYQISQTKLPTKFGDFNLSLYHDAFNTEHLALWLGNLREEIALVRIHSECMTGDSFGSLRCDCGPQLEMSMRLIAQSGHGMVIFLRQEGRGIGLTEKIKAYCLQDQGLNTIQANEALGHPVDLRSYEVAVKILNDFQIERIRLLTNNPEKLDYVKKYISHVEREPLLVPPCAHNYDYQLTKSTQFGHFISLEKEREFSYAAA